VSHADLVFLPAQAREIERDKSAETGLHVGQEEIRPVERVPASRRDGYGEGVPNAAVMFEQGASGPTHSLAKPMPPIPQRGRDYAENEGAAVGDLTSPQCLAQF
jgi:hypothetical protein